MAKREDNAHKLGKIDEEALLASMAKMTDGKPVQNTISTTKIIDSQDNAQEESEIEPKTKKVRGSSKYQSTFLNPKGLKDRRSVYVSADLHETILAIIGEIAVKSMTVGAFIDTIIRQHLEDNKEEINNLYCRKRDTLIK